MFIVGSRLGNKVCSWILKKITVEKMFTCSKNIIRESKKCSQIKQKYSQVSRKAYLRTR
jgi:hypothetical protein